MVALLLRRVLFSALVVLVASVIVFALVDGLGASESGGSPQARYAGWMGGLLRGNLGESSVQHASTASIIASRAWPTVLLMGSSLALTMMVAIPFGAYLATRRHSALDGAGRILFYAGYSLPGFWLGAILQLALGVYVASWVGANIFYTFGMHGSEGGVLDLLRHLALPLMTLSAAAMAQFARFQRGAMLETLSADYVRTARAKGLSRRMVHFKHALRNALLPTLTLFALSLGAISGGALVVEVVFAWPGLGLLLIDSLAKGDYEVVRALLMINVAFVVFFNLVADLAYAILDPRLTYD